MSKYDTTDRHIESRIFADKDAAERWAKEIGGTVKRGIIKDLSMNTIYDNGEPVYVYSVTV